MRISRTFYNKPTFWIGWLIVYNCIYRALIHFFHLPSTIVYLNDFVWVLLGIMIISNRRDVIAKSGLKPVFYIVVILLAETLLGYVTHLYQPLIYLWGLRTFFRYFVFFLACVYFLTGEHIEKLFKFLYCIVFINAAVSIFEFAAGYGWDFITGLYCAGRSVRGGGAGLNVLMCIVCAYVIIKYICKEISIWKMIAPILVCLFMAAIGELKAFYLEFVMIGVLCILFTRLSARKLVMIAAGAGLTLVGLFLYSKYYGDKINIYSIEALKSYAGTDGSTYGRHLLNRTTAVPYVLSNLLGSSLDKILGLGLGYGDNVSTAALSSGFYSRYEYLGYHYFFASLEVINIGLLGLILYYAIIFAVFVFARKNMKYTPEKHKKYYILTEVVCALTVFLTFYNQSLILDFAAFNIYFILAIPFALKREGLGEPREET